MMSGKSTNQSWTMTVPMWVYAICKPMCDETFKGVFLNRLFNQILMLLY